MIIVKISAGFLGSEGKTPAEEKALPRPGQRSLRYSGLNSNFWNMIESG
jgi:hypothetical protein